MTDADLTGTPASEVKDVALQKMRCSLDEDYARSETYLKCMAFNSTMPT